MSLRNVHCIELLLALGTFCGATFLAHGLAEGNEPVKRTVEEVKALIGQAGEAPPEWVTQQAANYPDTLDLSWKVSGTGWRPNHNFGAYLHTNVGRNMSGQRNGARVLHVALEINKDNASALRQTQQALAGVYEDTEEWAHAAYYYHAAGPRRYEDVASLAKCYYMLGCADAARSILEQVKSDNTRTGLIIKVWGEMGELDKALALASDKSRTRMKDVAYLAAGNACRYAGEYERATTFYEAAADASSGGRDLKVVKQRANDNLQALRGFAGLDLAKIPDGDYEGTARGFRNDLTVRVTIKGGTIDAVRVTNQREDRTLGVEQTVPARMVVRQDVNRVDATTGATHTSHAIMNAATKAMRKAAGAG